MSPGDDAMARYACGDDGAFADVYRTCAPRIHSLALWALADRAMADDVVQQTLMNMHRARGAFRPGAALLPWAYTIARRVIVDVLRARRRLGAAIRVPDASPPPVTPDDVLADEEGAERARLALAALPISQRTVLGLRASGLSWNEVATALGTTVTAVKLRLHRAIAALRRRI